MTGNHVLLHLLHAYSLSHPAGRLRAGTLATMAFLGLVGSHTMPDPADAAGVAAAQGDRMASQANAAGAKDGGGGSDAASGDGAADQLPAPGLDDADDEGDDGSSSEDAASESSSQSSTSSSSSSSSSGSTSSSGSSSQSSTSTGTGGPDSGLLPEDMGDGLGNDGLVNEDQFVKDAKDGVGMVTSTTSSGTGAIPLP